MTLKRWLDWRLIVVLGGVVLSLGLLPQRLTATPGGRMVVNVQDPEPTPFLQAPFFGTSRANCVFDHEYPIYDKEDLLGDTISTTVVHNDGSRASGPLVIGTTTCYSGHSGIDYGVAYKPVLAAAAGTVVKSEWQNPLNHREGYGLYVKISHSQNGYSTIYGHLSAIAVDAKATNPHTHGAGSYRHAKSADGHLDVDTLRR